MDQSSVEEAVSSNQAIEEEAEAQAESQDTVHPDLLNNNQIGSKSFQPIPAFSNNTLKKNRNNVPVRRKNYGPPPVPSPRLYRHRKMSFPISMSSSGGAGLLMGSPGTLGGNYGNLELPELANRRMRRFSNVSDAVSRKLSTTIGWRTVSVQDIVNQAKSLCGQYMRSRLKRSGLFNRKLGLQRLRSVVNLPGGLLVCEVFAQLQAIGLELERLHPKLYTGICRQVAVTITSEKSVGNVLSSIARELFKMDISWGKIVSLYCIVGGLAVDCVRHGHPEYLFGLVETMGLVIERDVATWMAQQGGWAALLSRYRPPDEDHGVFQMIALSVVCLIFLLVGIVFVIRTVGKIALGMNRIQFRPLSNFVTDTVEEPPE
ncbi:bcl-2-related ovarian killer protein homolog A-like isoform X2 [Tigriopus californicus]|uniref:bcl-2-related ovarian killer protein homolog A-like isoform X2 n=1 Tax=Tigriopus californicus TaxID=6832 RepID=UPI0027DA7496|nr:bcl-2-related ovarian killer protein homolog A-like isoform X2 [Tigriopus californicus]